MNQDNATKAEYLFNLLSKKFNLPEEWKFKIVETKERWIGLCRYDTATVYISKHLIEYGKWDQVSDTVRHELAHALDFEERGNGDHGPKWRAWARKVGAEPRAGKSYTDVFGENATDALMNDESYKWFCVHGETNEVYYAWKRKPGKSRFEHEKELFIRGKVKHTKGKLRIVSREEFEEMVSTV